MNAEHATLQSTLESVENEKAGLQQEVSQSQEALIQQTRTMEELQSHVSTIEADLSKQSEELMQWQTQASENSQAKEALELENQALSEQRQTLLAEQKGLQTTIDELGITISGFDW